MVYLNKKSSKIILNKHFPKNCDNIKLINTYSQKEYNFFDLSDESESDFFYILSPVEITDIEDGTYNIVLFDDNKEIETLLGVCGDYKRGETTTYEKEINRKVYER